MNDSTGAGTKNTHRATPARSQARKAMFRVVNRFFSSGIRFFLVDEAAFNSKDGCGGEKVSFPSARRLQFSAHKTVDITVRTIAPPWLKNGWLFLLDTNPGSRLE